MNLTPEEIYRQFNNNQLDKDSTFQSLKWIVENDFEEEERINSIEILGRLDLKSPEIYTFLENIVLSDMNAYIRYTALKVMLFSFPDRCADPLQWIAEHEQSPYILKALYDLVIKSSSWNIPELREKLITPFESRFGVVIEEVEFFLAFEYLLADLDDFFSVRQVAVKYYEKFGTENIVSFVEREGDIYYAVEDRRIRTLDLSSKRIKTLPFSLRALTRLSSLNISDTNITEIPNNLNSLGKLDLIILGSVPLKEIPDWLYPAASKIIASRYIKAGVHQKDAMVLGLLENLSGQKLRELRKEEPFFEMNKDAEFGYKLNEQGHVVGLAIYDMMEDGDAHTLTMIPEQIGHLECIEEIYFIHGGIRFIPRALCTLKRLKRLDLSYNIIKKIPECIGELKSLEFMRLELSWINELPETLGNLNSLIELNLRRNRIQKLPSSIGKLGKLKILDLRANRIKIIPESIGFLKILERLDLSENKIQFLPHSINKLRSLNYLLLRKNRIQSFPECITILNSLQCLVLGENMIKFIPESIRSLRSLQTLTLDNAQIEKLPNSMVYLHSLLSLNLEKNKFQVFPWCITSLTNLKELNLSGNHIKEIPESFKNLRHLTFLNLRNNRLKEIPDFIWEFESRGMFLKK